MGTLRTGSPDEVKAQIFDAAREAGLVRLMIAPGCVITVDTPKENIKLWLMQCDQSIHSLTNGKHILDQEW